MKLIRAEGGSSFGTIFGAAGAIILLMSLGACDSVPGSGPRTSDINAAAVRPSPGQTRFALIETDQKIVGAMEQWSSASLQATFGLGRPPAVQTIGVGDSVQVVIWEAGSGGLFSSPSTDRQSPGQRSAMIPEQIVGADGAITVPYAGRVRAAGRTPKDVEDAIVRSLEGKALEPQAVVTVGRNVTNAVTVVGEVTSGARVPLNAGGNRILDAVAQAGGTRAPVHETFIMLMRDGRSARIPMQAILAEPKENVYLFPNDVVTVTREPQTFTAVGATGQNAVLPFDAIGITLDQAIARAGGLNDQRADPAGVFVIRFESVPNYDRLGYPRPSPEAVKDVPVIYHLNLRDPTSFFLAHRFPIQHKDILYVSNSPLVEVQKVTTVINGFLVPGATVAAFATVLR